MHIFIQRHAKLKEINKLHTVTKYLFWYSTILNLCSDKEVFFQAKIESQTENAIFFKKQPDQFELYFSILVVKVSTVHTVVKVIHFTIPTIPSL